MCFSNEEFQEFRQKQSQNQTSSLAHRLSFQPPTNSHQLVECDLGTSTVNSKPPGRCGNSGHAHIHPDDEVAEEEPAGDEGVLDRARRLLHDVHLWRVEPEGSGWQSIGDQVHPQQLDWYEGLGQPQSCRQEDTAEREWGDGYVYQMTGVANGKGVAIRSVGAPPAAWAGGGGECGE